MTVAITLLGLGQIGASIGLALASHADQATRLGYDPSWERAQRALALGAVDKIERSLPTAVRGADVVVLALPADQIYETLKSIAGEVREEVVIMATSPGKAAAAVWAGDLLPPRRHFVGLTPALNPTLPDNFETDLSAANADLFRKGLVAVSAPPDTAEGAVQLAASFVTLLGARPFFADLAEVDGFMASAELLPELVAAALVGTVTGQPSWTDIRKLAGLAFASATRPLDLADPAALAESAVGDQANAVRVLDEMIAALTSMRGEIAGGEKGHLKARFEHLRKEHLDWLNERARGDWTAVELGNPDLPDAGGLLGRQIGGLGKLFRRDKKPRVD
jgi:prephenate dehydrogenase